MYHIVCSRRLDKDFTSYISVCLCVCGCEYLRVNFFLGGCIEVISAHYQGPFIVLLGIIHQFGRLCRAVGVVSLQDKGSVPLEIGTEIKRASSPKLYKWYLAMQIDLVLRYTSLS